jgi:hypothetical protein
LLAAAALGSEPRTSTICLVLFSFLRDIDAGIWRFCTSYNAPRPVLLPEDDAVINAFLELDAS